MSDPMNPPTNVAADPPFHTVLVANRGEIAVRIMATLRAMGIRSVAVYSEADRSSRHVLEADLAVPIGAAPPSESYLRIERIVEAAVRTGAQAVHPGYGLLSENAVFAEACEAAGVVFIGPTPRQLRDFGLKHTARDLARSAGVTLAPGSGVLADLDEARAAADGIGYPVMVKPSAGGGGIGMRICADEAELAAAFEAVRSLARNNFGDAALFLERYVPRARHVEVQVLGDGKGRVVTFPPRDCSLQRRHQKVLEETPAPNLPDGMASRLAEEARRLLGVVQYRSAGTVEFLVDAHNGTHAFLEVNTRLQVEHGVTELVTGIDLVAEMVRLAGGATLDHLPDTVASSGHAMEVRVYAEDPAEAFRPSSGLLTRVRLPRGPGVRVDGWVEDGTEISPFYDPLLAKVMTVADNRDLALQALRGALERTDLDGLETNVGWLRQVLAHPDVRDGMVHTGLADASPATSTAVVVIDAGLASAIQELPGRLGYWAVGIPPSGPMDEWSFRQANRAVGNHETAPALELTQRGPTLRFRADTVVALAGATMAAERSDGAPLAWFEPVVIRAGTELRLGDVIGPGCRTYLAVAGGFDVPEHLGSRATFALGGFGGHGGRTLRAGDVLRINPAPDAADATDLPDLPDLTDAGAATGRIIPTEERPRLESAWRLGVHSGPQGAPDFLTEAGIEAFVDATWEVHFHSDRTGVRLIGPAPQWARSDGGEAGLHPSNLHDNPYAVGTVDLTGDMPIILGPDGPSCGGFVCPLTVTSSEQWKLGQLRAGDTVRFDIIDPATSNHDTHTAQSGTGQSDTGRSGTGQSGVRARVPSPVLAHDPARQDRPAMVIRRDGDRNVLVEFGPHVLDLGLRLRIGALMDQLAAHPVRGVGELTPGVRSLQVAYDPATLGEAALIGALIEAEAAVPADDDLRVSGRIVQLPLSWDDPTARQAAEHYARVVRPDAPWCPWNLEFIRAINGLADIDQVRDIVFNANYLVLALGDVYLGAPVATPIDPRHRLVTTKYNPARTWTAENAVGIGGAYLCVYGMEGPGGYQLLGRTVQMWNRWRRTNDFAEPWLLRPFDQIRFQPVSVEELAELRADLPAGRATISTEPVTFSLAEHRAFLSRHHAEIDQFTAVRERAFGEERARWEAAGLDVASAVPPAPMIVSAEEATPPGCRPVRSPMAGVVSRCVEPGTVVRAGDPVVWIEAMKTETALLADVGGTVTEVRVRPGQIIPPGMVTAFLKGTTP
ncbi:MAG: urea carboxylase [Acidimicrobiales bacterium]